MAIRNKIDSNETSAYYAQESDIGVLPVSPVWKPLEPNSYSDFGGQLTLLARNPINASRQRKKGVITDLEASGGLNQDFTQENMQDLLQGFMFADFRNKPQARVVSITATAIVVDDAAGFVVGDSITVVGSSNAANERKEFVITAITGSSLECAGLAVDSAPRADCRVSVCAVTLASGNITVSPTTGTTLVAGAPVFRSDLGIVTGEYVYLHGFTAEENNGFKRVRTVTDTVLAFDFTIAEMVDATDSNVKVYIGRALKNEQGDRIVRRSYQIERQIGAPDTAQPTQVQSEYLKGAMPNELTLNIGMADKINADLTFIAMDNEQRTATQGIKSGTRLPLVESDAFNTSSDFNFLRLSVIDPNNAYAAPLFAYLTELSVVINNNISPNKAVAVLGAFDMTAGTFQVSASATAYFSTVEAVAAVRNNSDVNLTFGVTKDNSGFVCDMPLVALGDARLEVALNEPIMLPLSIDAATAAKLSANSDYTLMWCFFDYLPE